MFSDNISNESSRYDLSHHDDESANTSALIVLCTCETAVPKVPLSEILITLPIPGLKGLAFKDFIDELCFCVMRGNGERKET